MRVVVLGAGFGGLELSTYLSEELGDDADVVLIDREDGFVFGFSKLDVMFSRTVADAVFHPYADLAKPGVRFVKAEIIGIDPVAKLVETTAGTFDADILVVALGADLHPEATPGLLEGGHDFYTPESAFALRDVLAEFRGGRVVVGVTSTPFKCPPAPSETVVFCGVMNYAPNEEGAMWMAREVWPLVKQKQPAASLMLVGASPTAAVRALALMDPSVTVTGTVPDVRPFLWSAAVAAAPLQTARGVQNKVLEALAAGVPVVATPQVAEGLPPSTRIGVSVAGDAPTFAASIVELLRATPAARRSLAFNANLRELTWRERLKNLVPLLEEVARLRVTVH